MMYKAMILLSTYNGENYLRDFLESLCNQKNVKLKVLIRDDGSTDSTKDIIKEYFGKLDMTVMYGINIGVSASFKDLVLKASDYDHYFFADQDDIWLENKVFSAIEKMNSSKPSLYYSKATLVKTNGEFIGFTNKREIPTLERTFVGNTAIGCTMAFNNEFLKILKKTYTEGKTLHDAWAARVAFAVGANVIYDEESHIHYRQHSNNVVGVHTNSLRRFKIAFFNSFKERRSKSIIAKKVIDCCDQYMPIMNIKRVSVFADYRHKPLYRLKLICSPKYKKDNLISTFLFKLTVLFGIY